MKLVKGITIAGTEQKGVMFAGDVLVFLEEPETSFIGLLSGYKLNILKTQVMTVNCNAPRNLQNKYKLKWEANSIKYLDINLTKDLSKMITCKL